MSDTAKGVYDVVIMGGGPAGATLGARIALVIGNEGAGLSETLVELATQRVTIPMPGGVESLNVAAAAAICLFECVRRRGGAAKAATARRYRRALRDE